MNAIFFQSCHFVSVTEGLNTCGDSTKGINVRPFMNVWPELNDLAANNLHHPP